jgi:hypothetical protein
MVRAGWTVRVRHLSGLLLPGQRRRVSVSVQPPKGAGPQSLDLPVAILASVSAPALASHGTATPAYFAGGEPQLLGGIDLLTRVAVPGRHAPPFRLPPPPPPPPALRYPPPLPAREPSTLTLKCPSGGPFGAPETTTGTLSPPDPGSLITISYTPANGPSTTHVVAINPNGSFADSITPESTHYTVQASFSGDPRLEPSQARCTFNAG